MRLLADCSTAKMGGARTYFEQFLKEAVRCNREEWIVYGPAGCRSALPVPARHVDLRELPQACSTPIGYLCWLTSVLPRVVRHDGIRVVFAATGFGMITPPCPQLILIRNPIYFSSDYESKLSNSWVRLTLLARRRLCVRMIRSSHAVIFPTQAMREMVGRYIPLQDARCAINPYGCDAETFRRASCGPAVLPDKVRQLKGCFFLNVSHYCAQKNFTVLFKAVGILRQHGVNWPLLLTTRLRPAPNCPFREDMAVIKKHRLEETVVQLGPMARERLPALYQAAGIFLFPSFVESFGHPLVEAMASGVPIVAADTPVNREICQEAALYAQPFDPEDWADRIQEVLHNPALVSSLRMRASIRCREFSWERHVGRLLNLAKEVLAEDGAKAA